MLAVEAGVADAPATYARAVAAAAAGAADGLRAGVEPITRCSVPSSVAAADTRWRSPTSHR